MYVVNEATNADAFYNLNKVAFILQENSYDVAFGFLLFCVAKVISFLHTETSLNVPNYQRYISWAQIVSKQCEVQERQWHLQQQKHVEDTLTTFCKTYTNLTSFRSKKHK